MEQCSDIVWVRNWKAAPYRVEISCERDKGHDGLHACSGVYHETKMTVLVQWGIQKEEQDTTPNCN